MVRAAQRHAPAVSVVRLVDGGVQRLVTQVKEPAAMAAAHINRSRVASLNERPQEVDRLLPMDDASERAVLALGKNAAVDQDLDQEAEAFRLFQVGAIELCIVRRLARPVGPRIERLASVIVAVSPVRLEQAAAAVGQHCRAVPTVDRHALDQPLLLEVPQIIPCVEVAFRGSLRSCSGTTRKAPMVESARVSEPFSV